MKRSEINRLQREALALFRRVPLQPAALRTMERGGLAARTRQRRAIAARTRWAGTSPISARAGSASAASSSSASATGARAVAEEKPYAEKLLVVGENQETPFHFHKVKMEDIIVRGGGNLMIEFHNPRTAAALPTTPVTVLVDGVAHRLDAGEPLRARARPERHHHAQSLAPLLWRSGQGNGLRRRGLAGQ